MSLVRYEPTNMINRLQEDMNKLFRANSWMPSLYDEGDSFTTSQWLPSVDIKENDKQFIITADIPGVDPKDIHVSMENGLLSIEGERKTEKKDEENGYKRVERSY